MTQKEKIEKAQKLYDEIETARKLLSSLEDKPKGGDFYYDPWKLIFCKSERDTVEVKSQEQETICFSEETGKIIRTLVTADIRAGIESAEKQLAELVGEDDDNEF